MIPRPKLSKGQYRFFASWTKTISEGIVLGSSAAFFLPETFQIEQQITLARYMFISFTGLILLGLGAILERRGERKL